MKQTRYEMVAERIVSMIGSGVLCEGAKLPSVRSLSVELGVSVNTVKEAYWKLEKERYIESRPQSGFYVLPQSDVRCIEAADPSSFDPEKVSLCRIYGSFQGRKWPGADLGISNIDASLWPVDKLSKYFRDAARLHDRSLFDYIMPPGDAALRTQIARLYLPAGADISPDDIVITNGCHESIFIALMSVCKPGDTVVFESPIYFSALNMLERTGLNLIEIPASENEGISPDTLRFVLENHKVKAFFSVPNFNNPLGFVVPDERKKEIVSICESHGVVLIEDDVYGELYFSSRPSLYKSFDTTGNVIVCSSVSKTVAPGLRVGWVTPGKFYDDVCNLKTLLNISTAAMWQSVTARFLQEGGYDRHMRSVRASLKKSTGAVRERILASFPEGTEVIDPGGGCLLWVRLSGGSDAHELYKRGMERKIMIAPGMLFSTQKRYENCFRINAGAAGSDQLKSVDELGRIAKTLC